MIEILIFTFIAFLLIGVPVAIALGAASTLAIYFGSHIPLLVVAQKMFQGLNNFSFLAIPLFLLAGALMYEAKLSERLVGMASRLVGRRPGGLANVATTSSAFFGAISGSAPATTAAVGTVLIPSMKKTSYTAAGSGAVVAASGALGLIIPPSITMVIYGVISGVSIGELFINGIIPGILLTLAICLLNWWRGRKNVDNVNLDSENPSPGERFKNLAALLMPVIIIVGIYSGAFTPTESAAVACVYGLLIGIFLYKSLGLTEIKRAFMSTAATTAVIMFLMVCANVFAFVITTERVPQLFSAWVMSITTDPTMVMLMMLGLLIVVGTFLDNVSALVLLVPTLVAITSAVGIDPMYFGVFTIIALAVGQFTPPVGLNLYIAANIANESVEKISLAVLPFVAVYVTALLIFVAFPNLLTLFS
ncbi:MAG: TRAP transporter large permease [Gammaproteobacteria bacterium]|uniref:TRAP transporter large permease protein n=1 Tax=Marinobacter litoralis TaxID=187981 RepID=A0A3M2RFU0_9GAMM|nr:TRAP transporter large permease [Marinobacter litoralis]MBR9870671.1 TRAP transporter large permease [Gammaproteobacteria bacterium]RMJ03815.1 Sialic acid TRAP transporter permease protein SiaT [Marinobacter litoralis]